MEREMAQYCLSRCPDGKWELFFTPTVHHFITESIQHITSNNHFSMRKITTILSKKQIKYLITAISALNQLLVIDNLPRYKSR